MSKETGRPDCEEAESKQRQERGGMMHKYMRTVGFSKYKNKRDMDVLLKKLAAEAKIKQELAEAGQSHTFCEIRAEMDQGMGVALAGEIDDDRNFSLEYYYPYVTSSEISSKAECSIQRHAEKETYAGMLDEYRVGISLIFYMENAVEFRKLKGRKRIKPKGVAMTGLSVQGKILLPVQKTKQQAESLKMASKNRTKLLEAAKNGDEEAIETLTIEDIDLYSMVSRRIMNEDIYSIIDTSFMPCGVECDQYSVIGEIRKVERMKNYLTGEEIYNLALDCNDMNFHVAINQKDLLGEPLPGRRFKGQIWLQGTVKF